jgi:hypothetical protein
MVDIMVQPSAELRASWRSSSAVGRSTDRDRDATRVSVWERGQSTASPLLRGEVGQIHSMSTISKAASYISVPDLRRPCSTPSHRLGSRPLRHARSLRKGPVSESENARTALLNRGRLSSIIFCRTSPGLPAVSVNQILVIVQEKNTLSHTFQHSPTHSNTL